MREYYVNGMEKASGFLQICKKGKEGRIFQPMRVSG
jgi:hypothetical protein